MNTAKKTLGWVLACATALGALCLVVAVLRAPRATPAPALPEAAPAHRGAATEPAKPEP